MDPVKEVLKATRTLLVRNIIPCEDFFRKLAQQNIFPESMIKDIKGLPNQEQQNSQILDLLCLRGLGAAQKFCDALQLSGHAFLADFLREELSASPVQGYTRNTDGSSLARRFPKLDRILQDPQGNVDRDDLAAYLEERIQEEVVKRCWRQDLKEKEKAMVAKQRQLEEAWKCKEMIEQKSRMIQQLEELVQQVREELAEKEAKIRRIKQGAADLVDKHSKSLDSQIQFNLANDKSLRRFTEREIEMNSVLQELNNQMDEPLQRLQPRMLLQRSQSDDMSTDVTPIMATKTKVAQILELLGLLEKFLDKYAELREERSLMLIHLGVDLPQDENASLLQAFRAFVVESEQRVTDLQENSAVLEERLNKKDDRADEIKRLEKELEETRLELTSKEIAVQNLQSDIRKIKVLLAFREIKTKPSELLPRPKSPTLPSRSQLTSAQSGRSHLDEERSSTSRISAKIETLVLDTSNHQNPKFSQNGPSLSSTLTCGTLLDSPAKDLSLPPLRKAKAASNQSWSYATASSIPARGQGSKQALGRSLIINHPATQDPTSRDQTTLPPGLHQFGAGQKLLKSKQTKQAFQGPYQKQQSYELQRTNPLYQSR